MDNLEAPVAPVAAAKVQAVAISTASSTAPTVEAKTEAAAEGVAQDAAAPEVAGSGTGRWPEADDWTKTKGAGITDDTSKLPSAADTASSVAAEAPAIAAPGATAPVAKAETISLDADKLPAGEEVVQVHPLVTIALADAAKVAADEASGASKLAPEIRALQSSMSEPLAKEFAAAVAAGLPVGLAAKPAATLEAPVGVAALNDNVQKAGDAPVQGATLVADRPVPAPAEAPPAVVEDPAEEVAPEKVKMVFPRDIYLTLQDRTQLQFKKGIDLVPADLVEHHWLVANGVKPYVDPETRVLEPVQAGASTTADLDSRIAK